MKILGSGLRAMLVRAAKRRAARRAALLDAMPAGQLVRARDIAAELGITERSVYRHIAALKADGVPIRGQAGIGHMRRAA